MAQPISQSVQYRLQGLNYELGKIYRVKARISILLLSLGFSQDQVRQLRQEHLEEIINAASSSLYSLCLEVTGRDPERRITQIAVRRFCLNGERQATLRDIGLSWGISRERVRQIEEKVLRRLRNASQVASFNNLVLDVSSKLVGQPTFTPVPLLVRSYQPAAFKKHPQIKPETLTMELSEKNVTLAAKWLLGRISGSITMQMIVLVLIGSSGPKTRELVEACNLHRVYGVLRELNDNSSLYGMLVHIYKSDPEVQKKIKPASAVERYIFGLQSIDS